MKKILVLIGLLLASGCAELSKTKVGSDGNYLFPTEPVSVHAPDDCLLDMFVYEGKRTVDFVTGRGYWMEGGQYAVIVYNIPPDITDRESYIKSTAKFFKDYMVKDRAPMGFNLKIIEEKETVVNGRSAYQAISIDPGKAIFVATSQLHDKKITVGSLVYPDKSGSTEQIPWACYNKFIGSISEK